MRFRLQLQQRHLTGLSILRSWEVGFIVLAKFMVLGKVEQKQHEYAQPTRPTNLTFWRLPFWLVLLLGRICN